MGTLRAARRALGEDAELLVVDGGSTDRTVELAGASARVLHDAGGRGPQLNAGAEAATGRVLVFLHADTHLDPRSGAEILRALRRGAGAGCHTFGVDPPPGGLDRYRVLETAVNLRTRLFGTATGDQAIFATRDAFDRAGGFPDHPLFEDVVLVRRLRELTRFRVIPAVARTSRRRWERHGFFTTVATHLGLRLAWWLRVPPERLARWYLERQRREQSGPERRGVDPLHEPPSGSRSGRDHGEGDRAVPGAVQGHHEPPAVGS